MPQVVAFEDVKHMRKHRVAEGGKSAWRTDFMRPETDAPGQPQAFLAESSGHRLLRTHFHENDQFQIFVRGSGGNIAKHAIEPFQVHFSRAYTPYGPIVSADEGFAFFTLRSRKDPGAQYLPEKRDVLLNVEGRKPWQMTSKVRFPKPTAPIAVTPLEGLQNDDGLSCHAISMQPHAEGQAPDPSGSNGQYIVVLGGSLVYQGREHKATTVIWVDANEGAFKLAAGSEGLEAVSLKFPRSQGESKVVPPAAQEGEYKVWACVLCSFVYDEAAGLPEDGIPPGTRWADVPESWGCPDCSAKKADFEMVEI